MRDAIAVLLSMTDDAWAHPWESVGSALRGCTEEEARWQAPCYAKEEREKGWPAPGTILWQVAHIAACKGYYTECIRSRPSKDVPERDWSPDPTLAALHARLAGIQRGFRDALAELVPADLDTPVRGERPLLEFVQMAVRHDIWHASQIAVARRLWRTRAGG
jgi:hypothetical protein